VQKKEAMITLALPGVRKMAPLIIYHLEKNETCASLSLNR
jgi:hypothetical protein